MCVTAFLAQNKDCVCYQGFMLHCYHLLKTCWGRVTWDVGWGVVEWGEVRWGGVGWGGVGWGGVGWGRVGSGGRGCDGVVWDGVE